MLYIATNHFHQYLRVFRCTAALFHRVDNSSCNELRYKSMTISNNTTSKTIRRENDNFWTQWLILFPPPTFHCNTKRPITPSSNQPRCSLAKKLCPSTNTRKTLLEAIHNAINKDNVTSILTYFNDFILNNKLQEILIFKNETKHAI